LSSPSWDPAQYQRFADERARPFLDLIGRVHTPTPAAVVDLGCGPGPTTALLSDRWPEADVLGIDSSVDMIDAAGTHTRPGRFPSPPSATNQRLRFAVGSIADWDTPPVDVIVSNAALQWVPDHVALLPAWAAALRPGGAIAFQVPRSSGMRAGEVFQAVAARPRWAARLGSAASASGPRSAGSPVRPIAEYVDVLATAGLRVDAWETTYQHLLPGTDPVLGWFSGTGLRPYLDALRDDPAALRDFRAEVGEELRSAYPARPYGTLLPFPRIFVVAHRA
jgi:trans-aconitate 2-methyltransferase